MKIKMKIELLENIQNNIFPRPHDGQSKMMEAQI